MEDGYDRYSAGIRNGRPFWQQAAHISIQHLPIQGSEEAIRKALVERYPRDSYTLASKLIIQPGSTISEEEAKQEIRTSLERSGAGYFDYYLVHAIQRTNYQKYEEYGIWDYVKKLKEEGLIRHYGFSFHADPELLVELLEKHPDAEFVQLQINYADWENPGVAARRNYEICKQYGKPVVVMEPVKGGILADPIDTVKAIFDRENNGMSYSSWALRFVASKDNLLAVLSGMSSLEQMQDNLSYMKDFKPLDAHEEEVIKEAQEALNRDQSIALHRLPLLHKGMSDEHSDSGNLRRRKPQERQSGIPHQERICHCHGRPRQSV